MIDNRNDLGQIIKQRRVMISMTLSKLATASGVSSSHLGRIERGQRFPSAYILRKIAKPLGFEEAELLMFGGFLSPKPDTKPLDRRTLDPYVTAVLAEEPVEIQRAVVGILSVMKIMAKVLDAEAARKTDQCRGNG